MAKNTKEDQKDMMKILGIIFLIALSTFFIMKWISPESKNLGPFLLGFGASFVGIVIFAYCLKHILDLYKQIKSKNK
jgi:hypothetical protein